MSRKKKKNPAAEVLIESLIEDLKDVHSDSISGIQGHGSESKTADDMDLLSLEVEKSANSGEDIFAQSPEAKHTGLWSELEQGLASSDESAELSIPEPSLPDAFAISYTDSSDEKTSTLANADSSSLEKTFATEDRTIAVDGFAKNKDASELTSSFVKYGSDSPVKNIVRPSTNSYVSADASLLQADSLRVAQTRILDLEKEVEKLRAENEELASAGEIIKTRMDEYQGRINSLEKEKVEIEESHNSEVIVLKGNLQYKDSELAKAKVKIEELESRLKSDFKKIRVKERELENRLELSKAEKAALVRSKDEYILDLKRKVDHMQSELDNYRSKVLELNKTLESNQEQLKRTVRALRLALTNLEVKEENIVPLKKAE